MIRVSTTPTTTRPRTVSRIAPRASLAFASRPRRSAAAPARVEYHGVLLDDGGAVVLRVGQGPARALGTGLTWGYPGQGPRQLAIALLADALGEDAALALGRAFYERVTSILPAVGWTMTLSEVLAHARALGWRGGA